MYYVYIIQSLQDKSYYKGYTEDPLKRLERHNNGESTYTSGKVPWKLVHMEAFSDKTSALKRERVLKKYSHEQIVNLIMSSRNRLISYLDGSVG